MSSEAAYLYSTDALRIQEVMQPAGTNETVYGAVLQVMERLWLVHILRTLEAKQMLQVLSRMAIVLDGPLAVYNYPAWLSQAIYRELKRLNQLVRSATGGRGYC